jgi:hypothetical protein
MVKVKRLTPLHEDTSHLIKCHAMKMYVGAEAYLHAFLTSALDGG